MLIKILLVFWGLYFLLWIMGVVWLIHPYRMMTWFFHDLLGWHKPNERESFDGCSVHSHCRFCGREIMEDSQGNWFTFN